MAGSSDDKPSIHSLDDHTFGRFAGHEHGEGEFDHDHDEDFLTPDSRALESVPLISMGLDVGSSGTQVIFTRLLMRGPSDHAALRRQVRDRETLYMSPVSLTPFRNATEIDEERLWRIVDAAFRASGITPDEVETGVVILTGEAGRRSNAAAVSHKLAMQVGELVCAAAGDHMEATLAAHGSGAVDLSRAGAGQRILNMDVGGATTKLALVEDGRVTMTAALEVGGRLIAIDRTHRISRLDPAGALWAKLAGFDWQVGDVIDPADLAKVAESLAEVIVQTLVTRPLPPQIAARFVTELPGNLGKLDGIMVSGGVAEYVHLREKREFGDLGWRLGWSLRRRFEAGDIPWQLLPPGECIRATALGASEHSVQISGQTIFISSHAVLLPQRNLPVIQPPCTFGPVVDAEAVAQSIRTHRVQFDLVGPSTEFAVAFRWRGSPSYERIRALAEGIAIGLADRVTRKLPLYIMLEGDAALTLGSILREDIGLSSDVLVIDGIVLRDFDYVDIGRIRMPSHTVPVTIKSLVFGGGLPRSEENTVP